MQLKLLKEKQEGKNYQGDGFKVYYRYKKMIAGDNTKNVKETIYLISGKAEFMLEDKTWTEEAPTKVEFPKMTYHKILALTDIAFILFEN